jgi:hypothetical protein
MIATPCQRNRLMQKLKAETCFRRRTDFENERIRRIELDQKEVFPGDAVPRPLGFFALMPSQFSF